MNAIWKFPLEITDVQTLDIRGPVRPLSVQFQHGTLCLWYEVCPDVGFCTPVQVIIVGTGHSFDEALDRKASFVGTVQQIGVGLVWHVFVALPAH